MHLARRAWCRTYQMVFRIALPVLPYNVPHILEHAEDVPAVLQKRSIQRVLIVTDPGIARLGLTAPLETPETESGGRIHTSTCTVAIMPEAEEIDFHLDMNDCKFDVFRASGNGGQCVNTTDSAVRLTHIPTGIVISCQDEKSQLKNKDKALKVLRSRLYEMELAKQHDAEAEARRSQIGTGDRSEKIRTYNFPQGRVTDHRIKLTLHRLDAVLGGDLDEILDSLIAADQAEKLSSLNEEDA